MRPQARTEKGETLIEVCVSIVIIGIVVSALFSTIVTTSNATKGQRYVVSADAVLRDAAELTKDAVRHDCLSAGAKYSVDYSSIASGGVTPPPTVTDEPCPPTAGALTPLTLTITYPGPHTKSLDIVVRSP